MKRTHKLSNRKNTRRKYHKTRRRQKGGVCPCAVPITGYIASYAVAGLGGLGLYSLKKKKKKKKKKKDIKK